MKRLLSILLLIAISLSLNAQLTNTKWKATLKPEDPVDALFIFSKDTLTVSRADNHLLVETMVFTEKDSIFTLQKISGGSNCETSIIGKYKFEKNSEGIVVSVISDDCIYRASILDKTIWIKQ